MKSNGSSYQSILRHILSLGLVGGAMLGCNPGNSSSSFSSASANDMKFSAQQLSEHYETAAQLPEFRVAVTQLRSVSLHDTEKMFGSGPTEVIVNGMTLGFIPKVSGGIPKEIRALEQRFGSFAKAMDQYGDVFTMHVVAADIAAGLLALRKAADDGNSAVLSNKERLNAMQALLAALAAPPTSSSHSFLGLDTGTMTYGTVFKEGLKGTYGIFLCVLSVSLFCPRHGQNSCTEIDSRGACQDGRDRKGMIVSQGVCGRTSSGQAQVCPPADSTDSGN